MAVINIKLAVDSDASEFAEFADQGLVNCYAIPSSKDGARSSEIHFSSGLTQVADTGDNVCRGGIPIINDTSTDDVAYFGFEGSIQKLTFDGSTFTATDIGIIPGRGKLQFARNAAQPVQIGVINDAGRFYIIEDDEITLGPSSGLPTNWNSITFAGNQIVLGLNDGRMFATNLLNMKAIDGLSYATAEAAPDGLVAVAGLGQELFAIGRKTTEAWRANGAGTGFPFSPLGGAVAKVGCIAKYSIIEAAGTLYWVTNNGFVGRLTNYQVNPISNRAVDLSIANVDDPETIVGYTYSEAGQVFYGITHESFTWELNINTGFWHERRSYNKTRWQTHGIIEAFGKRLTGDNLTGKIWEIDRDARTEGVDPLIVQIRTPALDPQGQLATVDKIEIEAVTGRAKASGTTTEIKPVIMLDWTDNGHAPYSSERFLSLGSIGHRSLAMSTTRLGSIRQGKRRTFRITCSDPVVSGFKGSMRAFVS